MNRTGIIFDFDGVIVISEQVHQRAWVDLASDYGKTLPETFLERGIGNSDEKLSGELSEYWNRAHSTAEILAAKRRCYQNRCLAETTYVPGIHEALAEWSLKFPLALATSSSEGDISPHLDQHGLRDHFRAVLTIESVTDPKPHPEIYLKAAAAIGVDPRDCFVFEDSIHGATAARAAGAKVIGVTTTLTAHALAPLHASISDYSDLAAVTRLLAAQIQK